MKLEKMVWLASYPRTGSNWVRTILSQVMGTEMGPGQAIPSFKGLPPSKLPCFQYQADDQLVFLKTHISPDSRRMRDIENQCVGLISIYRHPLDIFLSLLNFAGLRGKNEVFREGKIKSVEEIVANGEIEYYVDEFCRLDGFGPYKGMCGGLSDYQAKWDNFGKAIPHLRICYEDMVAKPSAHVAAIHDFFGIEYDSKKIDLIERESEAKTAADGKFFWKKQAFNFEQMLQPDTIERFCTAYQGNLEYLGYGMPARDVNAPTDRPPPSTSVVGQVPVVRFQLTGIRSDPVMKAPPEKSNTDVASMLDKFRKETKAKSHADALDTILLIVKSHGFSPGGVSEFKMRFDLGTAYLKTRQFELGADQLAIATTLDPLNARAQYIYGWALDRLGRMEHASAAYDRALALSTESAFVERIQERVNALRRVDGAKPAPNTD